MSVRFPNLISRSYVNLPDRFLCRKYCPICLVSNLQQTIDNEDVYQVQSKQQELDSFHKNPSNQRHHNISKTPKYHNSLILIDLQVRFLCWNKVPVFPVLAALFISNLHIGSICCKPIQSDESSSYIKTLNNICINPPQFTISNADIKLWWTMFVFGYYLFFMGM